MKQHSKIEYLLIAPIAIPRELCHYLTARMLVPRITVQKWLETGHLPAIQMSPRKIQGLTLGFARRCNNRDALTGRPNAAIYLSACTTLGGKLNTVPLTHIPEGDYYIIVTAAEAKDVSPRTIQKWIDDGILPSIQIPRLGHIINAKDLADLEPRKAGRPPKGASPAE